MLGMAHNSKITRPAGANSSWKDRLRTGFLPIIRQRGEHYAKQGRVRLAEATLRHIRATVAGTEDYTVSMAEDRDGGRLNVSCTCPFFAQGNTCKHLWAAAVETDRVLSGQGSLTVSVERNCPPRKSETDIPPTKPEWRIQLDSGNWQPAAPVVPWDEASGRFQLRYEVQIQGRRVEVSAVERYIRKDGTLGRMRAVQASTLEHGGLPRADRAALVILSEIGRRWMRYHAYSSYSRALMGVEPESRDLEVLLPLLAETGRCQVRHGGRVLADPLRLGSPFTTHMEFVGETADKASEDVLSLVPVVRVGTDAKELPLTSVEFFLNTRPVLFLWQGRLFELEGPSFSWLRSVREAGRLAVPRKEIPDLLSYLDATPETPTVRLPEGVGPPLVTDVRPSPVLLLEIEGGRLRAQLFMEYAGLEIPSGDSRQAILDLERWQRISRDGEAEAELVRGLKDFGFVEWGDLFERDIAGACEAVTALADAGWRVEGRDRKPFVGGRVRAMRVSSRFDWFDLEGDVAFGDQIVPLSRAVRAYLRGERLVRLGNGSVGFLPEEWLSRNAPVLGLAAERAGRGANKGLRFPSTHALLLDALLLENDVESLDRRFLEIREALRNFKGVDRVAVPEGFRGCLRPYQEAALGWFGFLKRFGFGGVLADDMGLGKTVQVLAWLLREKKQGAASSLVVAPTSVIFNWQAEVERFAPELRVLVYAGSDRHRLLARLDDVDLVLITYGVLRRDIEVLRKKRFHYVILDESQAIKNAVSQTAKAARLLHSTCRLCLTGTPLENSVSELWSQLEFLNPGLLGSMIRFERRFTLPIAEGDTKAKEALKRLVNPFILRRTKESVAKELQKKLEHVVRCPMTHGQALVYGQLRDYYRTAIMASVEQQGLGRSRMRVLEGLLRLRQAASHPALVGDETVGSGKLDELMVLVEETVARGHKALIFSQFTRLLALIRRSVESSGIMYEYLDGRTPRARREERVRHFQEDETVKLFLISLKAGGLGLNLTAADYVFLVDPWWNPAVEMQAVDRTHRIGQKKKVFTYRLITEGTVEEKVLALQAQKQELVTAILAGSQDLLRQLSREDLEMLFS